MASITINKDFPFDGVAITDCNTALSSGIYGMNTSTANRPSGVSYAIMTVHTHRSGGWTIQLASDVITYKIYYRVRNNTNFSDWKQIIPNDKQTGTLEKYTGRTGTLSNTACYKVGNVVNVGGALASITNEVGNGAFFLVPSGFRPVENTRCICYITVTGQSTRTPTMCTIYTDGTVSIAYSQSLTITDMYFAATYPIA